MRLKRNTTPDGMCKYSLIEHGLPGTEDEFFVIKLKDRHASVALIAYAQSVYETDPELARDVMQLAYRSGPFHPKLQRA